jgi:hypothetical protein
MISVLFANEGGTGRGHALALRRVADALGPAFAKEAALYRDDLLPIIQPVCDAVFRGPGLSYDRTWRLSNGAVATSTFGEFLGDLGFRDVDFLSRNIAWWKDLFASRAYDLVVTEYAPCALLAARASGIRCAVVGGGYGIPADGLTEFPVFLPQHFERIYDESEMVAAVNKAAVPLGLDPIGYLPQVFDCDAKLVTSLPLFDPYDGLRLEPLLSPGTDCPAAVGGSGEEVFVYLSNPDAVRPALIEALARIPLPVRAYLPWRSPAIADRLLAGGVTLIDQPAPPDQFASRTRLFINAGQSDTMTFGFAAGLPSLAFPEHLEHTFQATRAQGKGLAQIAPDGPADALVQAIELAYQDTQLAARTQAVAPEIRAILSQDRRKAMQERLRPVLVDIVKQKGLA